MQISVKSNIKEVLREYRGLQKSIKSKAIVRSLNHSAARAYSRRDGGVVKRIAAESGLKQKYIRAKTRKIKASGFTLTASLEASTRVKAINLIEWVTKAEQGIWLNRERYKRTGKLKSRSRKGVTANAWNEKKEYKGAFIIKGKYSRKPVVISRKNQKGLGSAIDAILQRGKKKEGWSRTLYGPQVWTEFRRYSEQEAREAVDLFFRKEFERQVALLSKK